MMLKIIIQQLDIYLKVIKGAKNLLSINNIIFK